MDAGSDARFDVRVGGVPDLHSQGRQIVFHGINKSGSLALTRVLADGYRTHDRANQFFSTYLALPKKHERLREIMDHSTGHAFFGGHYLYQGRSVEGAGQTLVTLFRNPLPRVRSAYQWLVNRYDLQTPFEPWVRETRGILHSQVAQFGIGYGPDAPDWRARTGEELLERAQTRIERDVSWLGIAEHFEETIFVFAALCGLPTIGPWQRDSRNPNRPLVPHWPAHEVELVREVFCWDFELYAWAVDRFERTLAGLEVGPELARYREACRTQYNDRLDATGAQIQR